MPDPQEIILITQVYNSGAATLPISYEEQIQEVIEDGVCRPARTQSVTTAIRWLMDNGYIPQSFRWIDPPNPIRRRRCTYVKENGHGL